MCLNAYATYISCVIYLAFGTWYKSRNYLCNLPFLFFSLEGQISL